MSDQASDDTAEARTPLPASIDEFFRDGDVMAFLRSLVLAYGWGDRQDVDDIVQDACVRLLNAWSKLEDVQHARRVAVLAARHAAFDARRARRMETQPRLAALWTPETGASLEDVLDHLVVYEALRGVPRDQAEALLLLASGQLTYEEAASALRVSPNRFKGLIQRARENVRRFLGELPAAFLLGWRPRRVAAPTMAAPAFVAAAALCLTVAQAPALDSSPPSGPSAAAPVKTDLTAPLLSRTTAVPAARPGGTSATARTPRTVPDAHAPVRPGPRRLDLPKPSMPASACTGDVCTHGGPQDGDRVCVAGIDPTCAKQDRVAVCDHVHENPFATCERDGDPAWVVPPPP